MTKTQNETVAKPVPGGEQEKVEIAFRWYCSACGLTAVFWHLPAMTCDAKERAVIREHSERQPGCPRLDYRIVSDSETRPLEESGSGELARWDD